MKRQIFSTLQNPCRLLRQLLGAACLLACSSSCFTHDACAVDWSTKHQPRIGPNLVSNSFFRGTDDWALTGATYDGSVSRFDDATGSIKLFDAAAGDIIRRSVPKYISVTPGESYTFSAYTRTSAANGFPPPIVRMHYTLYSNTGGLLGSSLDWGRRGVSEDDSWEEITSFVNIPQEIGGTPVEKINLQFFVGDQVDGTNRDIWVDDVYFGVGKGFEQPPTPKTAFDGKRTRVDELGNMEILRNGTTWEPFFPLGINLDASRPDWSVYSNQGFNMVMGLDSTGAAQRAKDAGLMVGIRLSPFVTPSRPEYNDVALITSRINLFKQTGLIDEVALFYWDNEAHGEWSVPVAITDAVKQTDVDANGDRLHPIFTLNAHTGHATRHLNDQASLSDITGTYIGGDDGSPRGRTDNFRIADNVQNQKQPVVFAQLNRGLGDEMRARLFGAIAHGARGMAFWRDSYVGPGSSSPGQIENLSWWGDFPSITSEIDQMMDAGLIQVPHWTDWSIDTPTDGIDFGTRDLNGEGYLIAANYNDLSSNVTFTLDSLGYTPVEVRDFFTDTLVATLTGGNQFDVTLAANSSGVYRLVAPETNLGDFDNDGDVDGADFLVWQRGDSPNGATAGDLTEWQSTYGTVYGSLAAAETVPEPTTALLALISVVCLWGRAIRKTSDGR